MAGSPARTLGAASASALVVAAMVGTGVFTTSGFLLADLGSPILVLAAWAVGGLIAALGALCYGALARRLPESGGEYLFLSRTLHPVAGTLAGWVTLLVGFAAPMAAGALGFAEYARPWLPQALPPRAWASLLLIAAAGLHAMPLSAASRAQTVAVVVELAVIAGFILFGAARVELPTALWPSAPAGGPGAFAVALVWVSFSYAGWNTVVYLASEVRHPERNLPRAMMTGAGLVTVLYVAINAVFLFAAPAGALAGRMDIARIAAHALGGPRFAAAVSALVAFVLVTFTSSMAMAGPHVVARMAADGYLPRALAALPAQPPRRAGALQLALALALIWTAAYDALVTYVGFTLSLCTAATVVGLIRLRLREGPALRVPGWPVVPGLFLVFVLGSAAWTTARRPRESAVGLGTLVLAGIAVAFARRGRRPQRP